MQQQPQGVAESLLVSLRQLSQSKVFGLNPSQTFFLRLKELVVSYPQFKLILQWCFSHPTFVAAEMSHQEFAKEWRKFVLAYFPQEQDQHVCYQLLAFVVGYTSDPWDAGLPLFERTKSQIILRFYRMLNEMVFRYHPQALMVTLEIQKPELRKRL